MAEETSVPVPSEIIDVTPHPRLLAVLGDIEFAPWQCLAELIDNAFDDFLSTPTPDVTPSVSITLPSRGSNPRDAQVWVTDNGRGMSLEHLNGALKAGWTSNARYGKLGLFGMGFNIATARLGNVTTVKTTRAGDPEWISVTLDLSAMAARGSFAVPVLREPKDDPADHGTQISISDLKTEQYEALSRQQTKIRTTLGDIYSYLLRERGFSLSVDGVGVQPWLPCIWSPERFVVVRGERYPAFVEINHELTPLAACQVCGRWQDVEARRCEECGSDRIEVRERRIWGWLGIQRYTHKTDFGVDFLRNGRKILVRDVRLFSWEDPNEPGSRPEVEYPVEVPHEGRIVGEIHLDHVRVPYQKNAFEYNTLEWKAAVRLLRGDGPLRPKIAKERGYEENDSYIGRLFTAYRRLDPGLRCLVPGGDRGKAIHEKAREWAKLFRKAVPEYQDDAVWYEAARQYDEPKPKDEGEGDGEPPNDPDGDARERLDIPNPSDPAQDPNESDPPPPRETEEQKQDRYRKEGQLWLDMSGEYGLPGFGSALNVSMYALSDTEITDSDGERVPVYVRAQRGTDTHVFVDLTHRLFTDFGADPREVAVLEIAEFVRERRGSTRSLSALAADLKERCLPDQKVTPIALAAVAHDILERVRERMQPVVAGNSEGYWGYISADDQAAAEQRFAREGLDAAWSAAKASGEWIRHTSSTGIARLIQQRPGDFLDGKIFRVGYTSYTDAHARLLAVSRIVGYLSDVGLLAEQKIRRHPDDLNRARLSCRLLEAEIADVSADAT